MTADLRRIEWIETMKERFKIKAMDQLWPPQQVPDMYNLVNCLVQFWQPPQSSVRDSTVEELILDIGQLESTSLHWKDAFCVLSMKNVKPPSKDSYSLLGISQHLRRVKGYQQKPTGAHDLGVLWRKLENNSDILKALKTKDFGKTFFQLIAQVLVCVSQSSKAGEKSGNKKYNFSADPATTLSSFDQSSKHKFTSDKDQVNSFMNHANCGTKTTSYLVNQAICGIKTTSYSANQQNVPGLSIQDLQTILQVILTSELLRNQVQAFQRLLYCAVSVQVLFFVVIAIIDQCEKLRRAGDDIKKSRLALKEKSGVNNLITSFSDIRFESGIVFQSATFEGQMYANHNGGVIQPEMMDEYARGAFGNGGGEDEGEWVEDMPEIPNFANFGDNGEDELFDDGDDDEFERRYRAAFGGDRALRRVPSVSSLPPVEDFLAEENGSGFANAEMLGGWANEAVINHGDLGEIFRQIEEDDPIPLDPEPPQEFGLGMPMWMDEPLALEQLLMDGENVANAA